MLKLTVPVQRNSVETAEVMELRVQRVCDVLCVSGMYGWKLLMRPC